MKFRLQIFCVNNKLYVIYIRSSTAEEIRPINQPDGGFLDGCAEIRLTSIKSTALWHDIPCLSSDVSQFICKAPSSELSSASGRAHLFSLLTRRVRSLACRSCRSCMRIPLPCVWETDSTFRRRSSEPSYHPIFGQIFYFEIFNYFDSGHSAQHIVKLSVSNLV